ncbi:Hypothetical protein GLP15_4421 [Giardia lamblia P15]|uniref:Uncharacterized protein n=1 Tax=Giardia intestinalis (strain P15) TaxID=658858 RepID=E1F5J0_GIAIA|nr:Hypothetical protein GLP15_4421 [Giardia lamblia P15]
MQVNDKQLLAANFTDLTSNWITPQRRAASTSAVPQDNGLDCRRREKAEAMRRGYEQRMEQMRLTSKRQVELMHNKANARLRSLQEKLTKGNEETLRDCDATLAIANTEKQLNKERLFIDWEMNVFLPIQQRIMNEVADRNPEFTADLRRAAFQEYLNAGNSMHISLDMPTNKYDPYKLSKYMRSKTAIKLDDPLRRPAEIHAKENKIYKDVGGTIPCDVEQVPRNIPVSKFDRMTELYYRDTHRPAKRVLAKRGLIPPMALDEQT